MFYIIWEFPVPILAQVPTGCLRLPRRGKPVPRLGLGGVYVRRHLGPSHSSESPMQAALS